MYTLTYQICEEFEQVWIDGASGHLGTQDSEGLFRTEGFFVRSVRGGYPVEDVYDSQHACLPGNMVRGELVRIAGAVELFVMGAGYRNDTTDLRRPRYLAEKTHRVHYVVLHLSALARVQRALRNREQADFFVGNQRLGNTVQIDISPRGGLCQTGTHGFRS